MNQFAFNEDETLEKIKHFLPAQSPLKDFIHHNSLHAFQDMKFYDSIFKASKIFGYQVTLSLADYRQLYKSGRIKEEIIDRIIVNHKGPANASHWKDKLLNEQDTSFTSQRIGQLRKEWKLQNKTDLDNSVHPLLFRILCSYLDQGIAVTKFPTQKDGFLSSIIALEKNSFTSFFKTKKAKKLFLGSPSISQLLYSLVGDSRFFEQYLFDQQFAHPGWSGIVAAIEKKPESLLENRPITLKDMITLELILEIDSLEYSLKNKWRPITEKITLQPLDLFEDIEASDLIDIKKIWQDSFEWSYYDQFLAGLKAGPQKTSPPLSTTTSPRTFQALFCIDERECSLRRHLEFVDLQCETLGTPGFFGVEFYFQPENAKFYDKLCPAPVTPRFLIKEFKSKHAREKDFLYSKKTHALIQGAFITLTSGFWSLIRLFQNIFSPKMSPAISNAFSHMDPHSQLMIENQDIKHIENGLQIGFTIQEMAARVESQLRGIGLISNFSSLIYIIAHGSSSANNPHHGAHDCGACSGRPGSVNARVFSMMANHAEVRKLLANKGLTIPETTHFLGALHDTASDLIVFYDEDLIPPTLKNSHFENKKKFESALDLNAKERSRRFMSINTKMNIKKIRKAIQTRSVSMFEPRPELGHGTNTLCIVGRRLISKNLFLDRRAFLNSYDYRNDLDGELLKGIMRPLGPVCGGINLEYYFSRSDNLKLGAGTKLPHNVMGLIGVANSCDGDLRPGLPLQMIEVHDPIRLMIVVEHFPEVVLKTIQSSPDMYQWYKNEWVHLVALHPEHRTTHYLKDEEFIEYLPITKNVSKIADIQSLFEHSKKMATNHISDATHENLEILRLND